MLTEKPEGGGDGACKRKERTSCTEGGAPSGGACVVGEVGKPPPGNSKRGAHRREEVWIRGSLGTVRYAVAGNEASSLPRGAQGSHGRQGLEGLKVGDTGTFGGKVLDLPNSEAEVWSKRLRPSSAIKRRDVDTSLLETFAQT